jgi:DNA-binding CsgD family transcriptional regulator
MATRACILANRRLGQRLRQSGVRVEVLEQHPERFLAELARRAPAVALVEVPPRHDRTSVVETLARTYPAMRTVVALPKPAHGLEARYRSAGAFTCIEGARTKPLLRALAAAADGTPPARFETLTPRERQVLRLVGDGHDNLKIGALLGITERTVKAHITSIYQRLGAQSRVELALAARGLFATAAT